MGLKPRFAGEKIEGRRFTLKKENTTSQCIILVKELIANSFKNLNGESDDFIIYYIFNTLAHVWAGSSS